MAKPKQKKKKPMVAFETQENVPVSGTCDPAFEKVRERFAANFRDLGELGAAVALYKDGRPVVDLWGGYLDKARTQSWQKDTLSWTASTYKGFYALSAHLLADDGIFSFDKPVAAYWPEFGQAGKEKTTVRQLVSHHAGLIYLDHAEKGSIFDHDRLKNAIEKQTPEWTPGTKGAYHSSTYVPLIDLFIRQLSDKDGNILFRERIAEPLAIDVHLKLRPEDVGRASPFHMHPKNPTYQNVMKPGTKAARAWRFMDIPNQRPESMSPLPNEPFGTARGFARLGAALAMGGMLDGIRILSENTVQQLCTEQWEEKECGLSGRHLRMAQGLFMGTQYAYFGPNPKSCGAPGIGGVLFMFDPDAKLGFGYTPNYAYPSEDTGPRCKSLVDAAYACL